MAVPKHRGGRRTTRRETPAAARRARRTPRSALIIASEALPFSKTGGLADVIGALPPALARLGWSITVAVPRYRGTTAGVEVDRFPLTIGGRTVEIAVFEAPLGDGAVAALIDCPELYDREGAYGVGSDDYPDNPRRFAVLVRAALERAARSGTRPSLVHSHDWQAGLAPVYLKTRYASHPVLGGVPSVLTIHNLAYQGLFEAEWLPSLDLPRELFHIRRLEYWGRISFLKGGITDAAIITTVSPTYAREIQSAEFGCGFDGILRERSADLVGLLNGIDTEQWDPSHDAFLPSPYSADDLSGKTVCKRELLLRCGWAGDSSATTRPLIGMISRMVDQKGLDLIASIADTLPQIEANFVVLGTGDVRYQEMWTRLASAHPDRISARIGFDEGFAHLIEAGADMFLMPSRFEPCGLNQMYSLRYGTVPIVRAVGGLADTVRDDGLDGVQMPAGRPRATGFVFHVYTGTALLAAIGRAIAAFGDRHRWRMLQVAGMHEDHSWDRSAREYVRIYERALKAPHASTGTRDPEHA